MKCPLFHAANMTHEERILNDPEECLKEECAWYDKDWKDCAIVKLVWEFDALVECLRDIEGQMPPARL